MAYIIVSLTSYGISSITGLLFLGHTAYYTPNSRHYLIVATHLWTFVSQLILLIAIVIGDVYRKSVIGTKLYNFGSLLIVMQLLLIALLNVYILQIFSVLDSRITENRIRILRGFLVLAYFVSCGVQLFELFYQTVFYNSSPLKEIADTLASGFPVIGILYETIQAIYIIYLIYQQRKKTLDPKDLNSALFLIVANRILDFAAVMLYVGTFITEDMGNFLYFFTLPNAIIGIHASALAYLFSLLKNLVLTKKQKNAHKKIPKMVQAPAQIQQNEPVQKDLATQKEGLQSKRTELISPNDQLESKKTEIIGRPGI